jgi:hypothetical protein
MHAELFRVYTSFQYDNSPEYHDVSPLFDFVVELAQMSYVACQAVLNSGFLDVVLCMYICNFTRDTRARGLYRTIADLEMRGNRMSRACSVALGTLCRQPGAQAVVSAHTICTLLWRPLPTLLAQRTSERQAKWRQLGPVMATRRLAALPAFLPLSVMRKESDWGTLTDLSIDLVEFTRHVTVLNKLDHPILSFGSINIGDLCMDLKMLQMLLD